MEKAFHFQLTAYAPLLKARKIQFREDDKTLSIGFNAVKPGWVIFISCRTVDTDELLELLLPILKDGQVPFQLIKNQLLQYRLNSGAFGEGMVGKVISLFPPTESAAVDLVTKLQPITEKFIGPEIPAALRLGRVLYAQQATGPVNGKPEEMRLSIPEKKNTPFNIPVRYRAKSRRHAILGKYYVPVQLLRPSPKGDIYKAINLKKLSFNWCLIKQGKPVALDDHFKREMKDRLLWQKEVLEDLANYIPTPKVLDYFELAGSSYLVLDFAEGEPLGVMAKPILNKGNWLILDLSDKQQLLAWFLSIVNIVKQIHSRGYVHRDITDSNFLVLPDGSLCIIDFELSYRIEDRKPFPPFVLGTFGYAAPEQLQYAVPGPQEDVYSIGALLCFLVTGVPPIEFIERKPKLTQVKLINLTGSSVLSSLICRCLHHARESRPELDELTASIQTYLSTLQ